MVAVAENTRTRVLYNQVFELTLPFSEVCMHMRVSDTRMLAYLKPNGMVQLLRPDFSPCGGTITSGEAGFHRDYDGSYFISSARNPVLKYDDWGITELKRIGGGFSWEHDDRDYVM